MKLLKVFKQGIAMELSGEMAYKWNFYTKSFAMLLADFVGPLITTLIYASTAGIPGWSFYEFLLFQGTLIIVFGLGHMIALRVPFEIIHAIREGEFDRFLVKPISPLIYLFATSFVMEGISQTLLGIGIVAFCFFKLGISVFSASFAAYLILSGIL